MNHQVVYMRVLNLTTFRCSVPGTPKQRRIPKGRMGALLNQSERNARFALTDIEPFKGSGV